MTIEKYKVTATEIAENNIKSNSGNRLTGTVEENKNAFDKLGELIAKRHNDLIDALIALGFEKDENAIFNAMFERDDNTVPSADVPIEWMKLGTCKICYNSSSRVIYKPSPSGTLVNLVNKDGVAQIWFRDASGIVSVRYGTLYGWNGEQSVEPLAAWETITSMNTAFPVGSVMITPTHTNPEATHGGTWKLFDKKYRRATYSTEENDNLFSPGTHCSDVSIDFVTDNNEIIVVGSYVLNIDWKEVDLNVGTINFAALGCSQVTMVPNIFASANAANGIGYLTLNSVTGALNCVRFFPDKDGEVLPAGTRLFVSARLPVHWSWMNDEFCNMFYWRRTS